MQAAVLLLLGVSLCGVHGSDDEATPVLISTVKILLDQVHTLQTQVQSLQTQVQSLQTQVQTLETSVAEQQPQQVAFFAAFHTDTEEGNHGPFNVATNVKYKKVLTNIGNGYNSTTGAFTAPLRGLYVFHFTMFATYSPPPNAVVTLKKNGVKLATASDQASSDPHDSSTRVAVVTLEAGDSVYVELSAGHSFYDYHGDHNSFSGFLLSPM